MKKVLKYSVLLAFSSATVFTFLTLTIAYSAKADTANLGAAADAKCDAQCAQQAQLAKQKKDPSLNCPDTGKTVIACSANPAGGSVTGHCVLGKGCKADAATGSNGKSMGVGDLSSLMSTLGQLMKSLGGGGGGGGSGSGSGAASPTTGGTGCTQYYAVSTPSADPCAYYVPQSGTSSVNITTGTGNGITDIGAGGGDTSGTSNPISNLISTLLGGDNGNTNTNTNTNNGTGTTSAGAAISTTGAVASSTATGATGVGANLGPGGATGDIRVLPNGATIIITNQNSAGNTVTAGFLGTEATGGAQPTGLAASWCKTRPWAGNFLSFIIPATFFDSLCALRGYQVGLAPQVGGQAQIGTMTSLGQGQQSQSFVNPTNYTAPGVVPTSPPVSAQIWAVPPAVPLGGRTTIFWTSKNASSCTETSPDGSFSHTTLAGGGATVPLAGPTDFTISCMAPDGAHITADVLVNLAL